MKKILILLIIIACSFSLKAQRVFVWEDSINLGALVAADTIMQPKTIPSLVGSYVWSVELDAEDLNANNSKVYIGGGDSFLRGSSFRYKFNAFTADSMPKTMNRTALSRVDRNGGITDTVYTYTFTGDRYYFDVPMIKATKGGVTDGWLRFKFNFYKQ